MKIGAGKKEVRKWKQLGSPKAVWEKAQWLESLFWNLQCGVEIILFVSFCSIYYLREEAYEMGSLPMTIKKYNV